MNGVKCSTVVMACQTTEELVNLLLTLVDAEDPSLKALLEPYNHLIWKQDDSPSCAILIRHDLEDGTHAHQIGMSFQGVDYIIHDRDMTKERDVERLKSWFPTLGVVNTDGLRSIRDQPLVKKATGPDQ